MYKYKCLYNCRFKLTLDWLAIRITAKGNVVWLKENGEYMYIVHVQVNIHIEHVYFVKYIMLSS